MDIRSTITWCALALIVAGAPLVAAQDATEQPAPTTEEGAVDLEALAGDDLDVTSIEQILRGDQQVLEGEFFTYDPAGRRDPFRSLLQGFQDIESPEMAERPPGLPGMLVEEVVLQGIIETPTGIIAFVQGRDNLSYIIQPGTTLYNGEVKEILPKKVIFRQQTNDPKQLKPYQDVVREIAE